MDVITISLHNTREKLLFSTFLVYSFHLIFTLVWFAINFAHSFVINRSNLTLGSQKSLFLIYGLN